MKFFHFKFFPIFPLQFNTLKSMKVQSWARSNVGRLHPLLLSASRACQGNLLCSNLLLEAVCMRTNSNAGASSNVVGPCKYNAKNTSLEFKAWLLFQKLQYVFHSYQHQKSFLLRVRPPGRKSKSAKLARRPGLAMKAKCMTIDNY